MTTTPVRPVSRPPLPRSGRTSDEPLRVGVRVALRAVASGLVCLGLPALLVWAADSRSSAHAFDALRGAGQVWLAAHAVPMGLPSGRLSVVPLGLLLLPLALLMRAGSAAARSYRVSTLRDAGLLAAAVAGPYALLAAAVAVLSSTGSVRPSVLGALVGASAVALLGAGAGVVRACGLGEELAGTLPERLRRLAVPTAAAVLVLLGAGALLVGLRLALEAGRAAELARAADPGLVGGAGLLLLGLVLVPNAAVWAVAWWSGPGFAVGVGTVVSPLTHQLGPVPALPLLAALPSGGLPVWAGYCALLVPVLAGVLAGWLAAGGHRAPGADRTRAVLDAALCGLLAGAGLAALAVMSGGAAGGARMAHVGPFWWQTGLAVAVEVAVPAAATAWLATRRR